MGFQKCPLCDGTGFEPNAYSSTAPIKCSVCNGTKIISDLTGLPPSGINVVGVDTRKFVIDADKMIDELEKKGSQY